MKNRTWRRRIVPYALIAPAIVYLAMFFLYPMYEGLVLAVYDDDALLPIRESPTLSGATVAKLPLGTELEINDRRSQEMVNAGSDDLITDQWFQVEGTGVDGSLLRGWVTEARIRVREEDASGQPLAGTVRPRLGEGADPLTKIHAAPNETSSVVGQLEQRATVTITQSAELEVWFLVQPADNMNSGAGWAPSSYLRVSEDASRGWVSGATSGEFTTKFIQRMVDDRFFGPALRTTLLLLVLIIPVQLLLALAMALVIHARIRLNSGFLYVFALPIGMSDLAAGILFFSIFTGNGLLNSALDGLGIIDGPFAFLTAETTGWILVAIVAAEVWRATSIMMVIIVAGLQAIPDETLEAAELFGANYFQRVRHIILPLLKPSIQVALILRTILALQVFAVVVALSGGDVVTVLANESFRQYADLRNTNVASAYALFILLLSVASAVFYLRSVRSEAEVRPT